MKPANIMGAPIRKANFHSGIIRNGLAVTMLHTEDHHCSMTLTPCGVFVDLYAHGTRPAAQLLVPFANTYFVEFAPDEVKNAASK